MENITFESWPKTPRLFRDMTVTEKIDGTNAAVIVTDDGRIGAQSRNRLITPENDNYGFARWVADNAGTLTDDLGPGRHFGEWWGHGIQRGYGLPRGERRFSLFNTAKWSDAEFSTANMCVVPVLYQGMFDEGVILDVLDFLQTGSLVAGLEGERYRSRDYKAEGIVVFHHAAQRTFKVLIENDDKPKGEPAATTARALVGA